MNEHDAIHAAVEAGRIARQLWEETRRERDRQMAQEPVLNGAGGDPGVKADGLLMRRSKGRS